MADNERKPKSSISKGNQNPPAPPESVEEETSSEDSFVDFGSVASIDEGASGVIPLDQLPDPASSPSVISWTQVIRQHQQHASSFPEADSVKIDSNSDKDLLDRVAREEKAWSGKKSTSDTDELTAEEVPMILSEEEDPNVKPSSSVELSAPGGRSSKPPSGSTVRFDMPSPPADAGGAMPMPNLYSEDEVVELPSDALMPEFEEDIPEAEAVLPPTKEEEITDAMLLGDGTEEESGSSVGLGEAPAYNGPELADHSSILDMLLSDPGTPLSEVGFGQGQSGSKKDATETAPPVDRRTGAPLARPTHPEVHMDAASRTTQPEVLIEGEESPLTLPTPSQSKAQGHQPVTPGTEWLTEEDDGDYQPFVVRARRGEGNPEEAVDLYAEAPLDTGISASGSFQVSQEQLDAADAGEIGRIVRGRSQFFGIARFHL